MSSNPKGRSELSVKRDIFLGGFTHEYNLELAFSGTSKTHALAAGLLGLLPKEALQNGVLLDMKGRDANNVIDPSLPAPLQPRGDELFFINAEYEPDGDSDGSEPPLKQTFTAAITTRFQEFVGSAHIKHAASESMAGPAPEEFSLRRFDAFPEIEITHLRLGIDLFQSRTFVFWGFAPYVGQTLLIEVMPAKFLLRITAERLRRRGDLPLTRENLFERLAPITAQATGFDILRDYSGKLKES